MADIPEVEVGEDATPLDVLIGLSVVILATFLGVANIKDDNIVQQMQLKQADRNDNWAWFQARNIRAEVYLSFAEQLSIPWPNETPEIKKQREDKAAAFLEKAQKQEKKADELKEAAEQAHKDYFVLNGKDDQFDLSEAALAIGLALMGVTALVKRYWLFFVALVPAAFGVFMGVAGFLGYDTSSEFVEWVVKVLS
jgi:hypothetical protein